MHIDDCTDGIIEQKTRSIWQARDRQLTAETVSSVLQKLGPDRKQLAQPLHFDRTLDGREDGGSNEQVEQIERRQKYQTHVALFQRHVVSMQATASTDAFDRRRARLPRSLGTADYFLQRHAAAAAAAAAAASTASPYNAGTVPLIP